jgi:hypothetical protein
MNIEHEGKTYEVLPLDRISEVTHAKLAGGKVWIASAIVPSFIEPYVVFRRPNGQNICMNLSETQDHNIQPLRLVPKEPVTFEAISYRSMTENPYILAPVGVPVGKRFRCVEIVEGGA